MRKQVVSLPKGRLEMKGEMLTASTRLVQQGAAETLSAGVAPPASTCCFRVAQPLASIAPY